MLRERYNFSDIDEVYTPFVGGYWTKTIKILILLHLIIYFTQLIIFFMFGEDSIAIKLFLCTKNNFILFCTVRFFLNDIIPLELMSSLLILAYFGGDLERHWRFYFLVYYIGCGIVSCFINPNELYVGNLSGALGILAAVTLRHPKRLIYGRITLRFAFVVIVIFIFFLLNIFSELQISKYNIKSHLISSIISIPMAFISVYIFPFISKKIRLWQIDYEIIKIYKFDILQEKVDEVLYKINESGINSITTKERKILIKASKEINKYNNIYKKK